MNNKTGLYKFWTTKEDNLLRFHNGTKKFKDLANLFKDRTPQSLQDRSRKLGINSTYINRKHSYDRNYWANISPITAYLAGNFAADGALKEKSYVFCLNVSSKDHDLLELYKSEIRYSGEIKRNFRETKGVSYECSYFTVNGCKDWFQDLEKYWNIKPDKSKNGGGPKNISDFIGFCYLIGLFDGDGWISCMKYYKTENYGKFIMGLCGSSENLLIWAKDLIDKYFPDENHIRTDATISNVKKISENLYEYRISGVRGLRVFDFLRKFRLPKLERKWKKEKAVILLDKWKLKRPDLFLTLPENIDGYENIISHSTNTSVLTDNDTNNIN